MYADTLTVFFAILLLASAAIFSFVLSFRILAHSSWSFAAGVQIGLSFFVAAPVVLALVFQELPDFDFPMKAYAPYRDLTVSLYLAFSMALINLWFLAFSRKQNRNQQYSAIRVAFSTKLMCWTYVPLAFGLSFYLLVKSGKLTGGHWADSTEELLQKDSTALVIAKFYEVIRVGCPVALAYLCRAKVMSPRVFWILLLLVLTDDVIISSNRFLIVIGAFSVVYAFPRRWKLLFWLALPMAPGVLLINNLYPMIRGLLWTAEKGSVTGAFHSAVAVHRTIKTSIETLIGNAFEAVDINALKYTITDFVPQHGFLWGQTLILRTFLFFLPHGIWSDRPDVFATTLGASIFGFKRVATVPLMIGEAYANFGWGGPIVLAALLSLFSWLFRLSEKVTPFFVIYGFAVGLAIWRFGVELTTTCLVGTLIIATGWQALAGLLRRRY